MISAVPQPSAVARITLARHACFCGALRSATIASSRRRSARVTLTTIPALIMRAWTASADLGIVRMNQTTSTHWCRHGWPSHRWKSCSASVDNRFSLRLRPNRDATGDDDTNLCAYKCCAPLGPNHSSGDVLARIVSRQQLPYSSQTIRT
jgi:hypothetical protein